MLQHPYDTLSLDMGAKLIFTPCPGTKTVELVDSLEQLKQAGADAVLSLMFQNELEKNGAGSIKQACQEQSLAWFQLPISDDAAPDHNFEQAWSEHKDAILAIVKNRGGLALHCKGGSGRTGLVIAIIMNALGIEKDECISKVQAIRPNSMKNLSQRIYFESF
ncbi:dual specificity protein phosphatase family protein [Catenovulum sp. SM1970]|uniref:phosphatase domain-containing putative toxin n=1 Tax=Marinifaba aquimaris TaxID=2741323 RepID=UPI001571CFB8|nr:dual specificity protein phosphatase family protein [Marinifaba aquimaris]NTS76501.1 dual specificity protein phosphatase family protein [Marinifaba aquimaris]